MQHAEIVSRLSCLIDSLASEVLYSVTMQDILTAITRRMGESALSLTAYDLELAKAEVKAALDHHLDILEYMPEESSSGSTMRLPEGVVTTKWRIAMIWIILAVVGALIIKFGVSVVFKSVIVLIGGLGILMLYIEHNK